MIADRDTEQAVLDVLRRFREAFAAHDAAAIVDLFAPDDDILVIGSEEEEKSVGPVAVSAVFGRIVAQYDELDWAWGWTAVSAHGDVAWVAAEATVHARIGQTRFDIPYRLTAVLAKRDGKWLWVQYHGSEPARPGEG